MGDQLRDFLCKYFRQKHILAVDVETTLRDDLRRFADEQNAEIPAQADNYQEVVSELWNMALERIVEPVWRGYQHRACEIRQFRITEYGGQFLEGPPIDRPNQYIDHLKAEVPTKVDDQLVVYVRESLDAYNVSCYFASTVMLGVAAERLLEILLDAYTNAIQTQTKRDKFEDRTTGKQVSKQYDEFMKRLCDLTGKNGITDGDQATTNRIRHGFEQAMKITFDTIISYRNYAAHPHNGEVPRHIIQELLVGFPLFCQRVYHAIEWLRNNKIR